MKFEPSKMTGKKLYQLLSSVIIPRPIVLVSTISPEMITNLAPFSYFSPVCDKPPIVILSIERKGGQHKDTLVNIMKSGDFVVNCVVENLMDAVMIAARNYPYGVSEVEKAGLTALSSVKIKSPRIKESPVNMECRLLRVENLGDKAYDLVFGEVVLVHVWDKILKDGDVSNQWLEPVGRLSGNLFCRLNNVFKKNTVQREKSNS